jgi:hypothetical protein
MLSGVGVKAGVFKAEVANVMTTRGVVLANGVNSAIRTRKGRTRIVYNEWRCIYIDI